MLVFVKRTEASEMHFLKVMAGYGPLELKIVIDKEYVIMKQDCRNM
jgi:hypothetical protein